MTSSVGWKHEVDLLGNGIFLKYNHYSKTLNGRIFIFKQHIVDYKYYYRPCTLVLEVRGG